MFFANETVKTRINEIFSDIGKLKNPEYNDSTKRGEAVKKVRFKFLALIKTEEHIAAQIKVVLKEFDAKY